MSAPRTSVTLAPFLPFTERPVTSFSFDSRPGTSSVPTPTVWPGSCTDRARSAASTATTAAATRISRCCVFIASSSGSGLAPATAHEEHDERDDGDEDGHEQDVDHLQPRPERVDV